MLKKQTLTKSLAVALILLFPCVSWAWSGKVVGVADGDTIRVLNDEKEEKIHLYGISCPEKGQAFSKKAIQFTSNMVFGKIVEVHRMDTDSYGRTLALVAVDKRLLNEELVKAGLAWVYDYYCSEPICESWKSFQLRAKFSKKGIWSERDPVAPWEFRKQKRKRLIDEGQTT